jgi:hypothetical protein
MSEAVVAPVSTPAVVEHARVWPAAILVGLLSTALGLITLDRKSLWFDEAFDAQQVESSWHSLARLIGRTEMSQSAYLVELKVCPPPCAASSRRASRSPP